MIAKLYHRLQKNIFNLRLYFTKHTQTEDLQFLCGGGRLINVEVDIHP
jgi:hypothetical protein